MLVRKQPGLLLNRNIVKMAIFNVVRVHGPWSSDVHEDGPSRFVVLAVGHVAELERCVVVRVEMVQFGAEVMSCSLSIRLRIGASSGKVYCQQNEQRYLLHRDTVFD